MGSPSLSLFSNTLYEIEEVGRGFEVRSTRQNKIELEFCEQFCFILLVSDAVFRGLEIRLKTWNF